ncbi:MAG TPA: lysylphosphatidylglycerol synthase transmembrane domain-containing protein [Solirubrobacterales bacterium]|nr:lysylphosphatidylglycerol synthase transmembrane domain-containing protein [Solirubrobacterales bacterium]
MAVGAAIAGLYVLLPAVAGLDETWDRLSEGDPSWLSAAFGLELLSFGSYVVLFRAVFATGDAVGWRESYRITMAGVAATRLLATAGAGGVVLTVWALRRRGVPGRDVTIQMATFLVLLYGVFMAALLLGGLGLRSGVLAGPAPFGLTVVPAAFGGVVIGATLLIALVSDDLDQALARRSDATGRAARWARSLATAPATVASGVAGAFALIRSRNPGSLGAVGWWAFDIAVLWACLEAFGDGPTIAVVVMAYFVGSLANVLPVPGGIGAVDGGMIGALIGFGVGGGLAIVAVLSYRAFAFWLPTIPGAIAYVQLVRDSAGTKRT